MEKGSREPAVIRVGGASDHNLKAVDLEISHGAWTSVVGPSGSGKSTLVFETLVREGERRYLGALSAKARQFFGKLGRSHVRELSGLPVPIAVGHRSITSNPRSTVGTQSGVLDLLRLLFARSGVHPEESQLSRSHFSFNTDLGACEACSGSGVEDRVEPSLLVADGSKSIRDGALVPTLKNGYTVYSQVTLDVMDQIARAHGFDVDTPWDALKDEQRCVVFYGTKKLKVPFGKHALESRMKWEGITARPREEGYYRGLIPVIEETLKRSRNDNILRFVESVPCAACRGTRLGAVGREALVGETSLPALLSVPAGEFVAALGALPEDPVLTALRESLQARAERMAQLGLGHLAFDRSATTLSAGEAKRLRLAAHLTGGLGGALYALDEPTLGLHPSHRAGMRDLLDELVQKRNTLVVVEHDPDMVRCADHVVALGPGAGPHGGEIVGGGSGANWSLAQEPTAAPPRAATGTIELRGATLHNLDRADIDIDLGVLNVVVGPSGAGKTSLVLGTLLPALRGARGGAYAGLKLSEGVRVEAVDARPMGRSSRSTPATWSGAFDGIRKAFAATAGAKAAGLTASHFSFNAKSGRCTVCEGVGTVRVGLHLLEDAVQVCGACGGERYGDQVLGVRLDGLSIADMLALSVEDAAQVFATSGPNGAEWPASVRGPIEAMVDLGVGYLRLGTPSTQLSSGEAQRIRLATLLAKERMAPSLFVFDEPDRGLDPGDIQRLVTALRGLCERGHTVVAISHHRHVWRAADALTEVKDGRAARVTWADVEGSLGMAPRRPSKASKPASSGIRIRGARTHNLKGIDVDIAHGAVTAITGGSGSGKSSLAFGTLAAEALHRYAETLPFQVRRYMSQVPRPHVDSIDGLTPTVVLKQSSHPPGGRSTVATQSELGPFVRLLFARAGTLDGAPCTLTQSHFSPDRAVGACLACEGRGERLRALPETLVTDPTLSLGEGAFGGTKAGAFFTETGGQYLATLRVATGHDLSGPWSKLPAAVRDVAMHGTGAVEHDVTWSFKRGGREGTHHFVGPWEGFLALVEREAQRRGATKTGKPWLAALVPTPCSDCDGIGLGPEPRRVRLGSLTIGDVFALKMAELVPHLEKCAGRHPAWGELGPTIIERVDSLAALGLGGLALGTRSHRLSVSDLQRIRLASVLFSGLSGATIVLDEPGAGLVDADLMGLTERMAQLAQEGNTVVVVTHREPVISAADHVLTLGPGAGSDGGEIVPPAKPSPAKPPTPIEGAAERVALPSGLSVPVTGFVALEGSPGAVESLWQEVQGARGWSRTVDARARVQATMPLTALDLMGELQRLYHGASEGADFPRAAFSFMSPKGRCPACAGSGANRIALDFMADLDVPCETCDGTRYRPEVLEVTWQGWNVAAFLGTPVVDLSQHAEALPAGLQRARQVMLDLGLGHLALGRRVSTLSGGEAQRLALAVGLLKHAPGTLCLLEQPGTGLSDSDLRSMVETLRVAAMGGVLFLSTVHRTVLRECASESLLLP